MFTIHRSISSSICWIRTWKQLSTHRCSTLHTPYRATVACKGLWNSTIVRFILAPGAALWPPRNLSRIWEAQPFKRPEWRLTGRRVQGWRVPLDPACCQTLCVAGDRVAPKPAACTPVRRAPRLPGFGATQISGVLQHPLLRICGELRFVKRVASERDVLSTFGKYTPPIFYK